jgi:hypothetical protein
MALIITDTAITSDHSAHTARRSPGSNRGWEVSWLPGTVLDRDTATTAMILADIAAKGDLRQGDRHWPVVEHWAATLGLAGSDAITRASQPPGGLSRRHEPASRQPDREAAD